jgi:hypothetical protein
MAISNPLIQLTLILKGWQSKNLNATTDQHPYIDSCGIFALFFIKTWLSCFIFNHTI